MEIIRVKYFNDAQELKKISVGDWIDLRANKDIKICNGEYCNIPLGVAMELPAGYEAIIAPRGSTFKNFGLIQVNGIGVVDSSYCGDNDQWFMPVYCLVGRTGSNFTMIKRGDRICQFRIQKIQPEIQFETVTELGGTDRGGLGSTGKNGFVVDVTTLSWEKDRIWKDYCASLEQENVINGVDADIVAVCRKRDNIWSTEFIIGKQYPVVGYFKETRLLKYRLVNERGIRTWVSCEDFEIVKGSDKLDRLNKK